MSARNMLRHSRRNTDAVDRVADLRERTYEDAIVALAARQTGMPYFDLGRLGKRPGGAEASETSPAIAHCPPEVVEEFAATAAGHGQPRFADLVSPLSPESFFALQYPHRRPVLFRGAPERFAHLVGWDDLDALLRSGALDSLPREGRPSARLRLVVDGSETPLQHALEDHARGNMLDERKLRSFLRHGATLVLDRVHEVHRPVADLAHAFETAMHSYGSVNLYASWRPTRGLTTHWDDHDVFVVQVRGGKRWRLFGPTRPSPTRVDVGHRRDAPTSPLWEGNLTAGDIFYIPRGWWHDAQVDASREKAPGSIHLTCQTRTITGVSLMRWLEEKLLAHEFFRRDVPLLAGEAALDEYLQRFRELVASALDRCTAPAVKADFASRWRDHTNLRLGPWIDPWRSPDWDRFGLHLLGFDHAELCEHADALQLAANGWIHEFDPHAAPLIRPLLENREVTVGALKRVDAATFPAEWIDDFLRALIKKAILVAAEPSDQPSRRAVPESAGATTNG